MRPFWIRQEKITRDARQNRTCLKVGMLLILASLICVTLLAGQAAAQDVPAFPHVFFGRVWVTENGNEAPAPVDVTIMAKVNGIECGSVKVKYPGRYGTDDQGNFDPLNEPALLVQSNNNVTIEEGATIEFYVEGIKANETFPFDSDEQTFLELTVAGPLPDPSGDSEAPDAGVNWAVVGGICGGAVLLMAAACVVLLRRRAGGA